MALPPALYNEHRSNKQIPSWCPPPSTSLLRKVSTLATHNFPFLPFLQLPISPSRQAACNAIMQKTDKILKASPFCVPRILPRRKSWRNWFSLPFSAATCVGNSVTIRVRICCLTMTDKNHCLNVHKKQGLWEMSDYMLQPLNSLIQNIKPPAHKWRNKLLPFISYPLQDLLPQYGHKVWPTFASSLQSDMLWQVLSDILGPTWVFWCPGNLGFKTSNHQELSNTSATVVYGVLPLVQPNRKKTLSREPEDKGWSKIRLDIQRSSLSFSCCFVKFLKHLYRMQQRSWNVFLVLGMRRGL